MKVHELMGITFRRRPTAVLPPDGTIAFLDNGTETRRGDRGIGGKFGGGEWRRLNGNPVGFEPTYWTVLDETQRPNRGTAND